jgi:hypothetical protein
LTSVKDSTNDKITEPIGEPIEALVYAGPALLPIWRPSGQPARGGPGSDAADPESEEMKSAYIMKPKAGQDYLATGAHFAAGAFDPAPAEQDLSRRLRPRPGASQGAGPARRGHRGPRGLPGDAAAEAAGAAWPAVGQRASSLPAGWRPPAPVAAWPDPGRGAHRLQRWAKGPPPLPPPPHLRTSFVAYAARLATLRADAEAASHERLRLWEQQERLLPWARSGPPPGPARASTRASRTMTAATPP